MSLKMISYRRPEFSSKLSFSAPGIVNNNPKIIDLFSYKFYVGPHKGGFGDC